MPRLHCSTTNLAAPAGFPRHILGHQVRRTRSAGFANTAERPTRSAPRKSIAKYVCLCSGGVWFGWMPLLGDAAPLFPFLSSWISSGFAAFSVRACCVRGQLRGRFYDLERVPQASFQGCGGASEQPASTNDHVRIGDQDKALLI